VIASSSCSVMAAHSGDLLGDDTKDISAATCWLPLSDLVARWRASMNFFHTHPPTPLNQIARSRCRQRRILPTRLPCSVSSRWRVIVARLFTLEYTTVCGWNPFPSSRRKKKSAKMRGRRRALHQSCDDMHVEAKSIYTFTCEQGIILTFLLNYYIPIYFVSFFVANEDYLLRSFVHMVCS
jgi:hypothetical protein